MITIQYCGQTCNRLYQYVFARLLAEKWKMRLECEKPDPMFSKAVPISGNNSSDDWTVCDDQNDEDIFEGEPRALLSYGFHQKFQFYKRNKEQIRPWVAPDIPPVPHNKVVVHIRRGDYFLHGSVLNLGYYGKALREIGARRVYVVGPHIDGITREYLDGFDPIYSDYGYRYDYGLLLNAEIIVMSNSTFCWWAAWMSNAKRIYYPIPVSGIFSIPYPGRHRWFVDNEPRYRVIDNISIDPGPHS